MIIITPDTNGNIALGQQGENEARTVQFDISNWISEFGNGEVKVLLQRFIDANPYAVHISQSDNIISWIVTNTDTAIAGYSKVQLTYTNNMTIIKSAIYTGVVLKSLGQEVQPPDDNI